MAADQVLASEAGVEILAKGGNAVDAAVATSFALSVVRPYSCGIGGGGFMVVYLAPTETAPAKTVALNYRETSPAGIAPDHYEQLDDRRASRDGGHAVAVPGTVSGLLYALEHWGTMDRADVLEPAIRIAEQGFAVDEDYVETAFGLVRRFRADPSLQTRFAFTWERFLGNGQIQVGDRIRLPEQARALRLIARDGATAFYEGAIAQAVLRAVDGDGGVVSAADLEQYAPVEMTPISFRFRGYDVLTMPPPSSGGIAMAQMLGILERTGTLREGVDILDDPADAHVLIETMKHAFADRATHLADPAFHHVPINALLNPAYLDSLAHRIDPDRTLPPEAYGTQVDLPEDHGTSHFCVIDPMGNAVACTETINTEFGSLLPVPEFGFCLNNEMDDFTTSSGANAYGLTQSDANRPEPGKRPLSSMTPTIVLDQGQVIAVAGASGGPRIITGTMQVLIRMLVTDLPPNEAIRRPRLHHQWSPNIVRLETWGQHEWPDMWPDAIADRGHVLGEIAAVGNVQAIKQTDGFPRAGSDPRKGGEPAFLWKTQ
ncbi:MAG: gamma-glutamyltransferase [Phycisphaeraceae bacterium]|nr:gamma-glutamyltransferase [Phycisphaerales bacterium]MCB9858817.1 gamma-glutamyltransferase [Phycisphaeraceae bacterium]